MNLTNDNYFVLVHSDDYKQHHFARITSAITENNTTNGGTVENTVVGSVEKAVGAAESYSETQNYLVDENLKGDLYYLETQNYLACIDYSIHFEA